MSAKVKKLLEDVHPLHIIREVHKWPVLYMQHSPERSNPNFKNKIWGEIAKVLFNDWEQFNAQEKQCRDLQRKWRNLRDTFKRQVEVEKRIREGQNIKKKTYVYFKYMLFLLPHIKPPEEEEKASPLLEDYLGGRTAAVEPTRRRKVRRRAPALDSRDAIDEDQHFLMSLIPSLRKMSDNEKLTAKVKILKVIKQVRSGALAGRGGCQEVLHVQLDALPHSIGELRGDDTEDASD